MEKEPKEIRILSRDEKKQWDMQRQFPDFEYLLGDVRDATRLAVAMEGVDYVFPRLLSNKWVPVKRIPLKPSKPTSWALIKPVWRHAGPE